MAEGKDHETFDGNVHIRERGIVADVALVRAHLANTEGNLVYRHTARNFNPVVTMAGVLTVVEAESIVEIGGIDPDLVITPGVYVRRVVLATHRPKDIEQRTLRARPDKGTGTSMTMEVGT